MIGRLLSKRPRPTKAAFPAWPRMADLEAHARECHLPVRILHEAGIQYRPASRTVPEQLLDMIVHGQKYAGEDSSRWKAIRYARLYAGEHYPVPSVALVELADALLYTPSGIAITRDGAVLRDSTVTFDDFAHLPEGASPENAPLIPGNCLSLLSLWDWNYAHWLMDGLPRLPLLQECPPDTKVLLRANPQSFQRQSLELLGLPASRIVEVDAPFVRVERLWASRSSGVTGIPHLALLEKLRTGLLAAADIKAHATERRVFISRSKTRSRSSSQRRILNQPEVERVLQKHGFETVHPETLPFVEQVRLFAGVSAMAGAHGAGSYNLLFAPAGTPVIELYNHSYWEHAACRISGMLGLPHFHLFSENADAERNFEVDVARLEKLLAIALPEADLRAACESIF